MNGIKLFFGSLVFFAMILLLLMCAYEETDQSNYRYVGSIKEIISVGSGVGVDNTLVELHTGERVVVPMSSRDLICIRENAEVYRRGSYYWIKCKGGFK